MPWRHSGDLPSGSDEGYTMTNAIRHRPPTALMTQALRPDCEVIGKFEVHPYFGPGKAMGAVPCLMAGVGIWWSEGTAWDQGPAATRKSATVIAAHDAVLQQHTKATKRRHHITSATGLAVTVMPGLAAGCIEDSSAARTSPFEGSDNGKSDAIFGPRDILAAVEGTQPIAVIRYGAGSNMGRFNFTVCSLPMRHPVSRASQTPSSVFLGMSDGDTAGAWISTIVSIITDFVIDLLIAALAGALVELGGPLLVELAELAIARWCGPLVIASIRGLLQQAINRGLKEGLKALIKGAIRLAHDGRDLRTDPSDGDDQIADLWDLCAESR